MLAVPYSALHLAHNVTLQRSGGDPHSFAASVCTSTLGRPGCALNSLATFQIRPVQYCIAAALTEAEALASTHCVVVVQERSISGGTSLWPSLCLS